MRCKKCERARKVTGDAKVKCLTHGLGKLCENLLKLRDREKLKLIKIEMRMR